MFVAYAVCFLAAVGVILAENFIIPEIRIEVHHPEGFRVSVPHKDGMQMFAFHGNVNKPMRSFEVGQYYGDVLGMTDGVWVYENKTAALKKGDMIYYWVYVLHSRLGYRRLNQEFIVRDFVTTYSDKVIHSQSPEDVLELNPKQECKAKEDYDTCKSTVVKLAKRSLDLEDETKYLKKTIELFKEVIERNGKFLRLSGRISSERNPVDVVEFVLREKLNLMPEIVSATRNSDRSITFEVSSVSELLNVLQEAKDKLSNSTSVSITV